MLKVGDIFEYEGRNWVVLQADRYFVRYDMFTLGPGEEEYSYLAMRLSKNGTPIKSIWIFSSESGSAHKVPRNIKPIGKAKVDYVVSNVNLTDFQK